MACFANGDRRVDTMDNDDGDEANRAEFRLAWQRSSFVEKAIATLVIAAFMVVVMTVESVQLQKLRSKRGFMPSPRDPRGEDPDPNA